jgi:fermentation-respiration switch protein FrsA (DUF1100 family)
MTTAFSAINWPRICLLSLVATALISAGTLVAEETWDKTFPKSEKVTHQKVTFKNRYGITLAADLYQPTDHGDKRLAAIAVSGPFGAVKEQSSGLYAQSMAERGFVTIAFDPSYTGESGGEPRHVASPDINTEDFSAAVDFLGLQPSLDRERIGIIGVCGWGGTHIDEISPRPILFIHGEKAHSLYFSVTAFEAAAEPKELLIIKGANHVDLYDRVDVIPFGKLATFFTNYLK